MIITLTGVKIYFRYGCSCGNNIMGSSISDSLCTTNVCASNANEYCGGPDNGSGTGKAAIIFKNCNLIFMI
jgi:hypothetical protein